jgi:predicted nucleic acid-binding protein
VTSEPLIHPSDGPRAPKRILAFLDTTEWSDDSSMRRPAWDSLRSATFKKRLSIAVSEVTIMELVRQAHEKVAKHNEAAAEARRKLALHLATVPTADPAIAAPYEGELRKRLEFAQVRVVPVPAISHEELLDRDLGSRKPFVRSGKGYRDALIWHGFVEWVRRESRGFSGPIYFVSTNRTDFGGEKLGQLHDDLLVDLPEGIEVAYLERLTDLVDIVRRSGSDVAMDFSERAPRAAELAGIGKFQDLVGFPLDDLPIEEPYIEFPPLERGVVEAVEVVVDDVDSELVDSVDGVGIWAVTCRVVANRRRGSRRGLPAPAPWLGNRPRKRRCYEPAGRGVDRVHAGC